MELDNNNWLYISIFLICIGLITAALGGLMYRLISGFKADKQFLEANKDRYEKYAALDSSIDTIYAALHEKAKQTLEGLEAQSINLSNQLNEEFMQAKLAMNELKSISDAASAELAQNITDFRSEAIENQNKIIGYVEQETPKENLYRFLTNEYEIAKKDFETSLNELHSVIELIKKDQGSKSVSSFIASVNNFILFRSYFRKEQRKLIFYLRKVKDKEIIGSGEKLYNSAKQYMDESYQLENDKLLNVNRQDEMINRDLRILVEMLIEKMN